MDIHKGQCVVVIDKWDYENGRIINLFTAPAQGAYKASLAYGDIIGDWHEEVIAYADGELPIHITTIPARQRFYTFMHDPIYRIDVALKKTGYIQAPHTSFFVGVGMKRPLRPRIFSEKPETESAFVLIDRLK